MNTFIKKALTSALLLSFTLLYVHVYSQKKIFEGYYMAKNGDSVRGSFTNYTQWSKNPVRVQFLPATASVPVELTSENTMRFCIDNYDTYLSYTGQRMTNPADFDQAVADKDTFGFKDHYQTISTFLRLVAKTGNLEIFALTDNIRTNYFFRLNKDPLQELKLKMYYDQNGVEEVAEYRQQLYNLFKNEIEKRNIVVDLASIEYTDESLSALLQKLTPVSKWKKTAKNPAAGLVVAAGASINFCEVTGYKTISEVNTVYNTTIAPLVTIGYMSPVSRSFGKFFVYPQLKMYSYKNKGEMTDSLFKRITTFKASLVAGPILNVGDNFVNTDKFKFFVLAGGGMLFLLNNKEQDQSVKASDNSLYQSSVINLINLTYNANLSAGITLKNRIIIEATYNIPVPVADFLYYTSYHSNVQLTLGYRL